MPDQRELVAAVLQIQFGRDRTVDVVNGSIVIEALRQNFVRISCLMPQSPDRRRAMPIIAPQLAEIAQLVADPGRATMLSTLMDGRALAAG